MTGEMLHTDGHTNITTLVDAFQILRTRLKTTRFERIHCSALEKHKRIVGVLLGYTKMHLAEKEVGRCTLYIWMKSLNTQLNKRLWRLLVFLSVLLRCHTRSCSNSCHLLFSAADVHQAPIPLGRRPSVSWILHQGFLTFFMLMCCLILLSYFCHALLNCITYTQAKFKDKKIKVLFKDVINC